MGQAGLNRAAGRRAPLGDLRWPGGRRIAVLVSVLFETWQEGRAPSYFPRTTPLKAGTVDHGGIQWGRYAANEGIWRIIRTLNTFGVPATVFCSGRSGELYPDLVREVVRSGHAVGAHGYTQDGLLCHLTPQEERATIRNVLDILERTSGERPDGWVSPAYSWTEHTAGLLIGEGVRWHADGLDQSLPRRERVGDRSIIAFPWSDFVDNRVLRGSPRTFFDVYRDTFDYLYQHEPMGLVHIGFHGHYGGRPLMTAMLVKALQHFARFPDVWFPGHREMADWFSAQPFDGLPYAQRFFAPSDP
jgi:peptidoglycan/xylan/chitin deacetylase (PgdA/CDA1 family)